AVVVDAKKEKIAVAEASKLGIPIIGIIDTNADPDPIDFPIAANDDSIRSIRILLKSLVDAAVEAKDTVSQQAIEATIEESTRQLESFTSEEPRQEKPRFRR
ncbi:MAG TPA: 30S ribosomal protein S2, partial [Candidatus Deferrimicrobium sp.]|nr:30S ribosomal protein S2 [Candidatus Deferrimicrobium sp.]